MRLSSPAFAPGERIPTRHTCKGPNISPPLVFQDVPDMAGSLALVVEDSDADNGWVHWLVYNIAPDAPGCDEGRIPEGAVDGICNGGTRGYEGPCPIYFRGTHRYRFMLYALDAPLSLPEQADTAHLRAALEGHVLATAELVGTAQGEAEQGKSAVA